MCGRFTLTSPIDQILDLFTLVELPAGYEPRYNIAPTQEVLVVRDDREGAREAVMMRWGLVPAWSGGPTGAPMINARSETVDERPAFRDAYRARRCLIPADGFVEWQRDGKSRQPHLFSLADPGAFGLAGLWERWRDEDGEWLLSCTILTTQANELVAPYHDRMPVIVAPDAHEAWLSAAPELERLREIMAPYPASFMRSRAVSTRINSVAHDDPACLQPAMTQGSLF